jgi:UDP-3-O-[3-hydroxymyristoyl] glucosamine N-acyltransferase
MNDMWGPLATFSKATVIPPNGFFIAHNSPLFFHSHSSQLLLQKSQLNQTHSISLPAMLKKKVYVFASAVIYVSSEGASKVLVGRACIIRPPSSVS